jgi:hypothetical protein
VDVKFPLGSFVRITIKDPKVLDGEVKHRVPHAAMKEEMKLEAKLEKINNHGKGQANPGPLEPQQSQDKRGNRANP